MRLKFRARRKVRAALDMTPFMDLAVQLVIFFMLTSTFATSEALDVDLPSASTASVLKESEEIHVGVDRNDKVFLDKKQVAFEELERLFRLEAEKGRKPEVRIGADKLASHGTVVRVMDAARRSGLDRFSIAASRAQGDPAPAAEKEAPAKTVKPQKRTVRKEGRS